MTRRFMILSGVLVLMAALPPWGAENARAAVSLSVREIDLGAVGPGETARAQFQIANTADGRIRWTIEPPADWASSPGRGLSGESYSLPSKIDVTLVSLKDGAGPGDHRVEVRVSSAKRTLVLRRTLAEGPWREALRIESDNGGRTLFLKFSITGVKSRAVLEVEPRGIDLGDTEPVREITRRFRISNAGAGVLRWQASSGGAVTPWGTGRGRYLSLYNEALTTGAPYAAPASLRDTVQLAGTWVAEKGYPRSSGESCTLQIQFLGSGAVIYVSRAADGTVLRAAVDNRPPRELTPEEIEGGRFEATAAEGLPEGPHNLQLHVEEGAAVLDGIFVRDSRVSSPPAAWIRLTPLSGTITRETDFVTVRMTLSDLKPGVYTDQVAIVSNGGTVRIPVSLSVTGEATPRHLAVWRYTRGQDILFTAQPEKEDPRYIGAYQRAGLAFRLYGPGTAGTGELYRWYNPSIGDHYYSTEKNGGRKNLKGYVFGGAIGNIATIRLPGTRELYRWYNPETGRHYFTTDGAGEGVGRKGYRFEGTVGFVLR